MGIFSTFFRRKNETVLDANAELLSAIVNGESITREMAMAIPAVAKNVDLICNTVAQIPIKLYKEENGNVKEVFGDVRVSLLNDDTKDTLTGVQFKKALVEDYLMGQGGYAYINKYRNEVRSLNYVEEKNVSIMINSDPIKKHYSINVNGQEYPDYKFLKVLRNTKNGANGKSVTAQISKALETAYQEIKYQLGLFKKGGNKRGFLKTDKRLSDEAIQKLKESWKKLYDNENEEKMLILNEGMDFKECSSTSVEMQLNDTKKSLRDDINDIFHIRENIKDTFKEAIEPILAEIECSLNRDLLLEREKEEYFFAFDLKEILKGDMKERFEAYKLAKETGWITPNEIRYLENYDRIDGLDIIAMSLGNVIFDVKTGTFYTPNTDSTKSMSKGGDESEE